MAKRVSEDITGRKDWPRPEGLHRLVTTTGSTTIVCVECKSPWGGLIYDTENNEFRHPNKCPKISI